MISVGYRYFEGTGVQLDGKNFARQSALTFVWGKFERRLRKSCLCERQELAPLLLVTAMIAPELDSSHAPGFAPEREPTFVSQCSGQ